MKLLLGPFGQIGGESSSRVQAWKQNGAQDDLSCVIRSATKGWHQVRRGMIRKARQTGMRMAMARTRRTRATASIGQVSGTLYGPTSGAAGP